MKYKRREGIAATLSKYVNDERKNKRDAKKNGKRRKRRRKRTDRMMPKLNTEEEC